MEGYGGPAGARCGAQPKLTRIERIVLREHRTTPHRFFMMNRNSNSGTAAMVKTSRPRRSGGCLDGSEMTRSAGYAKPSIARASADDATVAPRLFKISAARVTSSALVLASTPFEI
jgi:hypothetical protein